MLLAIIIGKSDIITPYSNQDITPVVKIKNINKEISFVLFVFHTFNAWGINAIVVQKPAKNPIYFKSKKLINFKISKI